MRGLRSINRQVQNSQVVVKYSTGNEVAIELIRMTVNMNKGRGIASGGGVAGWKGKKGKIGTTIIAQSIKYNFLKV